MGYGRLYGQKSLQESKSSTLFPEEQEIMWIRMRSLHVDGFGGLYKGRIMSLEGTKLRSQHGTISVYAAFNVDVAKRHSDIDPYRATDIPPPLGHRHPPRLVPVVALRHRNAVHGQIAS